MDVEVRVLFWAPHTECVGFSRSRQSRCARRLRGGGRKPGPQSRPCAGARLLLSPAPHTECVDFSRSRQSRCARRLRGGGRKPGPQSRPCAGARLLLSPAPKSPILDCLLAGCRPPTQPAGSGSRLFLSPTPHTSCECSRSRQSRCARRLRGGGLPAGPAVAGLGACSRLFCSGHHFFAHGEVALIAVSVRAASHGSDRPHRTYRTWGVGVVGCGCCGVRVLRCGRLLCIGIACRNGGIQPLWSVFQPE